MIDLIGDGIENPWNAKTMIAAADMFGSNCRFRDRKKLIAGIAELDGTSICTLSVADIATYEYVIALENVPGAESIFDFRLPSSASRCCLVAGNERFGLSRETLHCAHKCVQIPTTGKINTLNVAAAAAVGLFYSNLRGRSRRQSGHRPDLMLFAPQSHFELGSAIRSAAAFGWRDVLVEDSANVWFDCNRVNRSEGRAAARSARNPIRIFATNSTTKHAFDLVTVVSTHVGDPIELTSLGSVPNELLLVPDESAQNAQGVNWSRFGKNMRYVNLQLPGASYKYHYRLIASIAMAEVARQLGGNERQRRRQRSLSYDNAVRTISGGYFAEVDVTDLQNY